jgi:hypothetical protein
MSRFTVILLLAGLLCVSGGNSTPQDKQTPIRPESPRARLPAQQNNQSRLLPADRSLVKKNADMHEACRRIFASVQEGLAAGAVGVFSQHIGQQVFMNLRGGGSGYYSANQAYYVLQNYLKTRRLANLNFSTIGESEANPYATGSAGLSFRGTREFAQVYVSLARSGDRWVITQINIY